MPEDNARTIVLTVFGVLAAVVVICAILYKVLGPKIKEWREEKKRNRQYEEERIARENKARRMTAYWDTNRMKIHNALKKVFFPELVDKWVNLSDMLNYEVKDVCPFCGKKLDKSSDKLNTLSTRQRTVNAKDMYGSSVKLSVDEQYYDGGYIKNEEFRCYSCNKQFYEISAGYDSNDKKLYEDRKNLRVKWLTPDIETALGNELCDYIDSNGHI